MYKIITFVILAIIAFAYCSEDGKTSVKTPEDNSRQRRLLFYDEEGNLVKTYSNPYFNNFGTKGNNEFWNLMNPFFSILRPSSFGGSAISYMIPVSDAVIHQINKDPVYQNKLFLLSPSDPVVRANPLCNGKREPIPSPKVCSNFLNCWDGWAFEQECPDGLLFSNNGYCDYNYNVDCRNRKLKDSIDARCHRDFESFRNESDCNEFFVCVNGVPVRFKCPSDLYYSQYLGVCDYKLRVSCNVSTTPSLSTLNPVPEITSDAAMIQSTMTSTSPNKATTSNPTNFLMSSVYDSQTWTSMHVAMSRQDAIRQLKLQSITDVKTAS